MPLWRGINFPWLWTIAPPPPPQVLDIHGGLLHIDWFEIILSSDSLTEEGPVFALPAARRLNLTWQVVSSGLSTVEIYSSLDQINFILIDTIPNSSNGMSTILNNMTSIKAVLTDNPTLGLVTVTVKNTRGRL